MKTIVALIVYAIAMIAANLSIAHFGVASAPVNAFFFIGLDLTLRDWLHVRLRAWQMGALIGSTGLLTYALNPAAGMIAVASACAFSAAALVDWLVFSRLKNHPWLVRSNASNISGAAVDSIAFPTLAFGLLMPGVVVAQFVAKVAGGAAWSFILNKFRAS